MTSNESIPNINEVAPEEMPVSEEQTSAPELYVSPADTIGTFAVRTATKGEEEEYFSDSPKAGHFTK